MNFRKIIVFSAFIFAIFNAYSLNYNETYESVHLDVDGWCTNFPIFFEILNNTEYTDSDFQDDVCGENEDPVNDTCDEYSEIDANLKIFDGPFDGLDELFDSAFEENKMNFTFTQDGVYLTQVIVNEGEYNDYEIEIEVEECNIDSDISGDNVQGAELFNHTISYSSSQTTVTLENADVEEESSVFVKLLLKTSDRSLPELSPNLSKILEISYEELNEYTTFSLETVVDTDNISYLEIYKLENFNWTPVTSYTLEDNTVIFDEVDTNYYAIIVNEPEEVVEDVAQEEVVVEEAEEIPEEEQVVVIEDTGGSSGDGLSVMEVVNYAGLGLIIVFILYFVFSHNSKKSKDDEYDNYNVKDSKKDNKDSGKKTDDQKVLEKTEKDKKKEEVKEQKLKEKEEKEARKQKEKEEKEARKKEEAEKKAAEKEAKAKEKADSGEEKEGFFSRLFKKKEKIEDTIGHDIIKEEVKGEGKPSEAAEEKPAEETPEKTEPEKTESAQSEPAETTEEKPLTEKSIDDAHKEVIEKTRDYVRKYKDSYPQEGIRQALKSVNIDDETIDEVFKEEFK